MQSIGITPLGNPSGSQESPEKRLFVPLRGSHLLRSNFTQLFSQLQHPDILKTQLDINQVPVEITPVVSLVSFSLGALEASAARH
jgi:hypothetical protein